MNPSFLDNMSWEMAEVYEAVTDRILVNLAKYFPYIKAGKEPKNLFDYQVRMLAQMGQVSRETADIIAKSLDGADQALRQSLEEAITEALRTEEPKLRQAAEKGLLQGAGFVPPLVSPNQMQAFRSYYKQSADKLNLVNTVMLESTQDAYQATVSDIVNRIQRTQSILNVVAGEVVTGVSSWNTAMHDAVAKMVKNGLTGFIDHGGHHWSPEAYAAMDIRTTMFNTAREAIWERADEFGSDLYQVSSHIGARPLCYPWQGKVISRTNNIRVIEDLNGNRVTVYAQSETSYGQAAGLFGINCKHYPMTFIPGLSTLRGEPQNEEDNKVSYEQSQKQRELERKLRYERRDLAVLKAQGASEAAIKAQKARVDQADEDLEEFCDSTGLARRRSREYTPINASFPDKDSYNPDDFPTEQRDRMKEYFKGKAKANASVNAMHENEAFADGSVAEETKQKRTADIKDVPTLQMYDEALGWADDNYTYDLDNLIEGWRNVDTQVQAINEFKAEIPEYEKILSDAVERGDFSVRTNSGDLIHILEDGRFKSQIETGQSHGYLDIDKRKRATESLFAGGEQIELSESDYEIYGYLGKAPRANMYGNTRIVLKKDNLIDRTTITVGDSLELLETNADPVATLAKDPKIFSYGKVFSDSVPNAPQRLKDVKNDFSSIKSKGYLADGNYIELQFHGGVTVDDIDYVEMSSGEANAEKVKELAEKMGVKIKWKR